MTVRRLDSTVVVLVLPERVICQGAGVWRTAIGKATHTHVDQRVEVGDWQLLHLIVELADQLGPVLQADLEDLTVLDLADANEVEVGVGEEIPVRQILDDCSGGC